MKSVVLVGHCGPDAYLLKNAVKRAVPGVTVTMAADEPSVAASLMAGPVLLVNRVLDGDFATESGIELIRTITAAHPEVRAMLISNHAEAQAEAIKAGAMPGFGKNGVFAPTTGELLKRAVDPGPDGTV